MNNLLLLAQAEVGAMGPAQYLFGAVYLAVCLAMIGAILMKTPKNDGLGGMMGGGGSDAASFKGAKSKDDTIDTITNWIAVLFIAMSIGLNYVF
ncbi:MAG: preprotein translocase subunit SecG [Vulcanimicrobiota bacterium]